MIILFKIQIWFVALALLVMSLGTTAAYVKNSISNPIVLIILGLIFLFGCFALAAALLFPKNQLLGWKIHVIVMTLLVITWSLFILAIERIQQLSGITLGANCGLCSQYDDMKNFLWVVESILIIFFINSLIVRRLIQKLP